MARNKYPEETVHKILDAAFRLFTEKGYDNTSIQDIIDQLGGLSKGAIYHHFKSKEEIFNAVGDRYNQQHVLLYRDILDDRTLTGGEKLGKLFELSFLPSEREVMFSAAPDMLDNPKLLAMGIREIFDDVVPHYIQPVIEQGARDGTIHTEYPREAAEVIMLLSNLWMNPLVLRTDAESLEKRVRFFNVLLKSMGVDLPEEQMLEGYRRYSVLSKRKAE